MKNKKSVVDLLRKTSELLSTANEHNTLIGFAVELGLIYGQQIQISLGYKRLDYNAITFGEYGAGYLIANAEKSYMQKH